MMAGPLWLHRRFGIEVRREQADSAYADLVRLTVHDPAAEILAKLRSSGRH